MTTSVGDRDGLVENLREQQRATSHVLRTLARFEGPRPVFDAVVEAAVRLCEGEYGALYMEEGGAFPVAAAGGRALAIYKEERDDPIRPGRETVVGRVALTRDVSHIPDIRDDPEYALPSADEIGMRAVVGVPVFVDDELIGVLAVARNVPEPFSDEHVELLKTFADQAGIAIANARLVDSLEQQLEQQSALSQVLGAVARAEGLQSVVEEVLNATVRLSKATYGILYLVEGGNLRALAHSGSLEQWEYDRAHPTRIDEATIAGRAAGRRVPIQVPDILEDSAYGYEGPREGFRSGLGVPILAEEELVGVIGIVRSEPGPFADADVSLIKTFADQAAIAIVNARLIDAVEHQLEQQQAIADVLRSVARSEGLEAVFGVVVDSATRLSRADYGALYLKDGEVLRVVTQHYGQPDVFEFEQEHPHAIDRTTVIGRAALTQQVVHIPDTHADPDYSWGAAGIMEYRALLGAPILLDGELIGAMNVVRVEPEPFASEHIELLKTFADQAAIAIANARLIDAVERQKTELSRFVSPQVAELLSSDDGQKLLAGHRAYISCLFCDLRGSTSFTEAAEPEELFEVLREYHQALGDLIPRYGGTLEHFAGDGLMVFFNDPLPVEDHELKAVQLACAAQTCLAQLAGQWRKRGTELGLGIGIASGYATLGRIGFEGRYDYGALGPVTNLAARLSSAADAGQTLLSQRVYAAVEDEVDAVPVGELELKGFTRPVPAYEVRGLQ